MSRRAEAIVSRLDGFRFCEAAELPRAHAHFGADAIPDFAADVFDFDDAFHVVYR